MTFTPTLTLGDLFFIAALLISAGASWGGMLALRREVAKELSALGKRAEVADKRSERIEERMLELTGSIQRVIGAFEMHVHQHLRGADDA